jgi:hypothetical protein
MSDGRATPYRVRVYLGTHRAHWLADSTVPLFVSRRILKDRKSFPEASAPWVLDSGGFTELHGYGLWSITAPAYAREVDRYCIEIGNLEWAAPMDWMCEPSVVKQTGLSVAEHQRRTIRNYLTLMDIGGPYVPVLQGWTLDDYLRHADMYQKAGVCLTYESVVAVGSVCRRGQDDEIVRILDRLAREGLRLHAFGVRSSALARVADCIVSADSMSWSYTARRSDPLEGHTHKSCANCREYAERWYRAQLNRLDPGRLEVYAA